jgi:uncharacterized membrane protein
MIAARGALVADCFELGVLITLAWVLIIAAVAKFPSATGVAELLLAGAVVAVPSRPAAIAITVVFSGFAATHLRRLRQGVDECECFGQPTRPQSSARAGVMTAGSAILALVVAIAKPPTLARLAPAHPADAAVVVLAALLAAYAWRFAFRARSLRPADAAERLVTSSALFLERRLSRRTLLSQVALVGSALAVAPVRYLLYPGTALAAISPGDCAGGACTDGYTAFCCQINAGSNTCPEGTYPGGWWMCTDYAGRRLCAEEGVRYYVDCNALPAAEFPGGCTCAGGSCENQRVACNIFRYGQCNTQIAGTTAVVCRMVVCENPGSIPDLNCSYSLAVDDAVCGQDTPCLEPPAIQLVGAGGA